MCGILVFRPTGTPNPERFAAALDLLEHRGPDDRGLMEVGGLQLGHRRLSIIDLSHSAAQPMTLDDGDLVIVFNGEIYNFQEIRAELIATGRTFRTHGDTEVLLQAYAEYGIGFLEKLVGMFSFVLHDSTTEETYVVRDRLGIKPLYYFNGPEGFIASSEVKSILHLLDRALPINAAAISSYFSFRYPILDDSFFQEVVCVEPGTYLKLAGGSMKVVRYWSPAPYFAGQQEDLGEAHYLQRLQELLQSSVQYRQLADVRVGAYLSGGVDSSAIVALMSKTAENVPTFTIGFSVEGYNEFEYARQVADANQTDHHEMVLSGEDYFTEMEKLICIRDAPLAVPNEVPLHLMSKELKKHITVVLSGEGADEMFGGYGRIFRSPDEYATLVAILDKPAPSADEQIFLDKIQRKYGRIHFADEVDHFVAIYSYTKPPLKARFLTPAVHNDRVSQELEDKIRGLFNELGESAPYINKMMYVFQKVHLVGLLQRVDMTTMAASVEARVPFVDHRLVEFANSIPPKYKLKWVSDTVARGALLVSEEISETLDVPKYILKKSLEGELPDDILYRRKMGFPVPLDEWFGSDFADYARGVFDDPDNPATAFFDLDEISHFLDHSLESHADAMKIWMVVNVFTFCRRVVMTQSKALH